MGVVRAFFRHEGRGGKKRRTEYAAFGVEKKKRTLVPGCGHSVLEQQRILGGYWGVGTLTSQKKSERNTKMVFRTPSIEKVMREKESVLLLKSVKGGKPQAKVLCSRG